MFSTNLSQKIAVAVLVTALTACATNTPAPAAPVADCDCEKPYQTIKHWLAMERSTSAMESGTVVAELVKLGRPATAEQRFYFGLLNQQLNTPANWRHARNAFRQTRQDTALAAELRSFAAVLERYNRSRLDQHNARQNQARQQQQLRERLETKASENTLLQEKIQAITELETDMSTRIEQEQ